MENTSKELKFEPKLFSSKAIHDNISHDPMRALAMMKWNKLFHRGIIKSWDEAIEKLK